LRGIPLLRKGTISWSRKESKEEKKGK